MKAILTEKGGIDSLMKHYKKLEKFVHVWLDDVINKVTQEMAELMEANVEWDVSEMYKEAWDVLVNIYSVAEELWLDTNFDLNQNLENPKTMIELIILLWKWNTKIQWFRSRYSREDVSTLEVQCITSELVKEILNYSNPDLGIEQIIERNIEKFRNRIVDYKPDINIRDYITSYKDFPKPWIDFKDISPILKSPEAFRYVCLEIASKCSSSDVIVWLDARGFLFWTMIAEFLWKPFVMVRKKWKLPWKTMEQNYWLEYGTDVIELQDWSILKWQKVSVIDDLLATGWTTKATIDLVEKSQWEVNNVSFVISLDEKELSELPSRKKLENYSVNSVVSYE